MHRSTYPNPPPANSPPLHHPVPQHVSTVPQLRSPPPPAPQHQQSSAYGAYPVGAGAVGGGAGGSGAGGAAAAAAAAGGEGGGGVAGNYMHPAFGSFISDPTAQMGFQVGKSAMMAGHEYMEQNFNRYVNVSTLKHYFNVSNSYVVNKLYLVLFPWRHRPWSRQQRTGDAIYLPPRDDINSPDLYIPLMAFTTYILLSTLLAGLRRAFHPELFGMTATTAFAVLIFEILLLRLAMYLLGISNESQLMDLIAYSGYKFVGIIVTIVISEIWNQGGGTGGWVGWSVFIYTFLANAFFLLRSLKYVLLPDSSPNANSSASYTANRSHRQRRTQFLFIYSYVVQLLFMWVLTRQDAGPSVPSKSTVKT